MDKDKNKRLRDKEADEMISVWKRYKEEMKKEGLLVITEKELKESHIKNYAE